MKPLQDYSFIKGVNYDMLQDVEIVHRDLGYAKRLGLNSLRVWLSYKGYEADPKAYIKKLVDFVQACYSEGFTVITNLFNGNGIDPAILEDDFIERGNAYVTAVVEALHAEPGLLMYDIMNEPLCNGLMYDPKPEEERAMWKEKIERFVRRYCVYVKQLDPENAITVGNELSVHMEGSADLVDILSYHDYSETLKGVRENAERALGVAKKYGKPLINNETCCIARANPYDTVIQTLNEYGIPWYVFNLMIEGYWNEVHGIFYPDGTIRDPAIAAAIVGCFRSRDLDVILPEKANREMKANSALERLRPLLSDGNSNGFIYKEKTAEELLEICEIMANLLECGQLVPMQVPPTAYINAWRKQENPNMYDIKRFAYELAEQLKKACRIL